MTIIKKSDIDGWFSQLNATRVKLGLSEITHTSITAKTTPISSSQVGQIQTQFANMKVDSYFKYATYYDLNNISAGSNIKLISKTAIENTLNSIDAVIKCRNNASNNYGSKSDGVHSNGTNGYGSYSNGYNSDGTRANGTNGYGTCINGNNSNGSYGQGINTNGTNINGSYNPNGTCSQGSRTPYLGNNDSTYQQGWYNYGGNGNGNKGNGTCSNGTCTQSPNSYGTNNNGTCSNGSYGNGGYTNGSNYNGTNGDGTKSNGVCTNTSVIDVGNVNTTKSNSSGK